MPNILIFRGNAGARELLLHNIIISFVGMREKSPKTVCDAFEAVAVAVVVRHNNI